MILLCLSLLVPQDTLWFDFTVQTERSVVSVGGRSSPAFDSLALAGRLRLVLSDTVGGRVAHIRIDSVTSDRPASATRPQLGGSRYTVVLGHAEGPPPVATDSSSLAAMQGVPVVAALFPSLRDGIAINDRWVDTAAVDHVVAGVRSHGTRITSWFALDRRGDALLVSGRFRGAATATVDPSNTISLKQHGSVRAVVRPGWPADVSEVTDSAEVVLTLSGTALHIQQLTLITIVRRGFIPAERPNLRRRVPS